jgi:hypothetical protein
MGWPRPRRAHSPPPALNLPQRDLLAGLSVAVMVIPQGMSYAQNLAYLPQVYGLYGSFIPCILYAMLGSSRQLVVGPVAVTSLLLGSGLSGIFGDFQINPSDPSDALQALLQERYNHAAIQVAFIAGVIYTGIGLLRMGWVVNILSVPVVSGFMTVSSAARRRGALPPPRARGRVHRAAGARPDGCPPAPLPAAGRRLHHPHRPDQVHHRPEAAQGGQRLPEPQASRPALHPTALALPALANSPH